MSFVRLNVSILLMFIILGCVEKTTYSGKIITSKDLSNLNISNKNELIEKFGYRDQFRKFKKHNYSSGPFNQKKNIRFLLLKLITFNKKKNTFNYGISKEFYEKLYKKLDGNEIT